MSARAVLEPSIEPHRTFHRTFQVDERSRVREEGGAREEAQHECCHTAQGLVSGACICAASPAPWWADAHSPRRVTQADCAPVRHQRRHVHRARHRLRRLEVNPRLSLRIRGSDGGGRLPGRRAHLSGPRRRRRWPVERARVLARLSSATIRRTSHRFVDLRQPPLTHQQVAPPSYVRIPQLSLS